MDSIRIAWRRSMSRVEVIGYPEDPPRNGVRLGCGTLVVIAVIIMFSCFSQAGATRRR
jgi:hypothetical protein